MNTEQIIIQIKALTEQKEKVEEQIKNISLIQDTVQQFTVKVQFRDAVETYPFIVSADFKHRIAALIHTELTTQREQLITQAQALIGPVEHEEPKENETVPASQL